jgi:hypothetical protein
MSFHAAVGEPRLNEDVNEPGGTFGIIDPLIKIEPEVVIPVVVVKEPVIVCEPVKYEKLLSNSSLVSGEPFTDL